MGLEYYIFWRTHLFFFKKKYTNHEYKIRYENEYIFRTRKEITTNVLDKCASVLEIEVYVFLLRSL